jgi:hypothetical protein
MLNGSGELLNGALLGYAAPKLPVRFFSTALCYAVKVRAVLKATLRPWRTVGAASAGAAAKLTILRRLTSRGVASASASGRLRAFVPAHLSARGIAQASGSLRVTTAEYFSSVGTASAAGRGRLTLRVRLKSHAILRAVGSGNLSKSNADRAHDDRTSFVAADTRVMLVAGGR